MSVNNVKNVHPLTVEQCKAGRAQLGWSQKELAAKAGVGSATVSSFESGARASTPKTRLALIRGLAAGGVTFADNGDMYYSHANADGACTVDIIGQPSNEPMTTVTGETFSPEAAMQAVAAHAERLLAEGVDPNTPMTWPEGTPQQLIDLFNSMANSTAATIALDAKQLESGLPHDLFTHRNSWRSAFVRLIELEGLSHMLTGTDPDEVAPTGLGNDEVAFWEHELNAYDQMHLELDQLLAEGNTFTRDRQLIEFVQEVAGRSFTGVSFDKVGKGNQARYRMMWRGHTTDFKFGSVHEAIHQSQRIDLQLPQSDDEPSSFHAPSHMIEVNTEQFVKLVGQGWVTCDSMEDGPSAYAVTAARVLYLKPPVNPLLVAINCAPLLHAMRELVMEMVRLDGSPEVNTGKALMISSATDLLEQISTLTTQ